MNAEIEIAPEHYRALYSSATRELQKLQQNWRSGTCKTASIRLPDDQMVVFLQIENDKIVCALRNASIQVWDRKTSNFIMTLACPNFIQCLRLKNEILIACLIDATLRIWEMASGNLVNVVMHPRGSVIDFDFNDNLLATCSRSMGFIDVWRISNRDGRIHVSIFSFQACETFLIIISQ